MKNILTLAFVFLALLSSGQSDNYCKDAFTFVDYNEYEDVRTYSSFPMSLSTPKGNISWLFFLLISEEPLEIRQAIMILLPKGIAAYPENTLYIEYDDGRILKLYEGLYNPDNNTNMFMLTPKQADILLEPKHNKIKSIAVTYKGGTLKSTDTAELTYFCMKFLDCAKYLFNQMFGVPNK